MNNFDEINYFCMNNNQNKIGIFVKFIWKSLNGMEEWKRFQKSRFDEFSRRKLIENQDFIHEFTARIQELQNEVYCLNDSRDFKDAESVRSGLSHVTSQFVLFPCFRDLGGMLSRSVGMPSRNDKPPDIWDTHGKSRNVFVIPTASSSSLYLLGQKIQSLDFRRKERISPHATCQRQTPDGFGSEMPVKTVSQKFIRLWRGKIFKRLWGKPTKTADFGSSFWQILLPNRR